jgi:GT2 family glycosyltransferase
MPDPALAIVILNYNTCDLLDRCLQSVKRYAAVSQTIVVDNASQDASVQIVQHKHPQAQLIVSPHNVGFARGMNLGMAATTAPIIFTLNADTELLPNTLPPLIAALAHLPHAGILGPTQYLPDPKQSDARGPRLASAFHDPTLVHEAWRLLLFGDSVAARLQIGPWQKAEGVPRPVDWLMGAALLFRRECVSAIQGFDETQFMYGEDWDICFRARQAGWQVYFVPEAAILHHENAAAQKELGVSRRAHVLQANLYFHRKHFGPTRQRLLAASYWLGAWLRLALVSLLWPFWKAFPFLQEKWKAYQQEANLALRILFSTNGSKSS